MMKMGLWLFVLIAFLLVACSSTEQATPSPPGPVVPTRAPVTMQSAAPTLAPNVAARLTYGESVTGEIRGATIENRYVFDGQAADIIVVRMQATSGDLDAYLILQGPDGSEIARNDDEDSTQGFDAGLVNIVLPVAGSYTIIASRFNPVVGTTEGAFLLTLERGNQPEPTPAPAPDTSAAPETPDDNRALSAGMVVNGLLDSTIYSQPYMLAGTANQLVTLVMQAEGGLDPLVIVQDPQGREIARNDPATDGIGVARIANLPLPETGAYTVIAARFGGRIGHSSGAYTLSLAEGDADDAFVGIMAQPLGVGGNVSGEISVDVPQQVYTFEGRAGDVVSLISAAANPTELDLFMVLADATGSEIARNDDNVFAEADERLNSAIFFQPLPQDGYYSVILSQLGRNRGNYALELRLEARGDGKVARLYLGTLDARHSFGQLEDGARISLAAVGDWSVAVDSPDGRVEATVTMLLPVLPADAQVRSVLFDLSSCLFVGRNVFEVAGSVALSINAIYDSIDRTTAVVSVDDGSTVQTITDCEIIDITDVIREVYASGQQVVQFHLALTADSLIGNGSSDAVIFPYPRLEVTLEQTG